MIPGMFFMRTVMAKNSVIYIQTMSTRERERRNREEGRRSEGGDGEGEGEGIPLVREVAASLPPRSP